MQKRASIPREFAKTWQQLQWIEYDYREGTDRVYILPKKDLPESPDFADSWVLSLSRAMSGSSVLFL